MSITKWLKNNTKSLANKNVVVTGATGGLGKELCFYLAELNANITLACRNEKLANSLKEDILVKFPETVINFVPLDLGNMQSVNSCIEQLKSLNGIDVLIHNAGVYNVPLKTLDTGYNNIFQINFLAPYYITKQLLPELEKKENSVCLVVGSVAHNYSKLNKNDIDFSSHKKASKMYGNSKRFLMFSLYELFKNEKKVSLAVAHPGITLTNMTNHYPKSINWLVKIGIKLIFASPKKAALNLVKGVFTPCAYHEWIGPKIFNIWGKPKKKKLKTCDNIESEKIYNIAEKLYLSLISNFQ